MAKLTTEEVKQLLHKAQRQAEEKAAGEFWDEYPRFRNSEYTRESYVAERLKEFDAELPDDDSVEWNDLPEGEFDGHEILVVENIGGEGEGEYAHVVFTVDGAFYKQEGFYSSYDGTYWDEYELKEVEPYTVEVTKYRPVSK